MNFIEDVGLVDTALGDDGPSKEVFELCEGVGWSSGCESHERDSFQHRCQMLQVSVGRSADWKRLCMCILHSYS